MRRRRNSVGDVSKLPGIRSGHEDGGEHHQQKDRAENDGCHFLKGTHCVLHAKARPARSASEFAASITRQTIRVTFTMRGKSRLSAACQASCPRPGESHRASMGIAAPKAIAKDTPKRARSGGAATGRTCRQKIALLLKPLGPSPSTGGWAEGRSRRPRA